GAIRVLPEPLGVVSAFPLLTPGKNRKIPWRAVSVKTTASTVSFCCPFWPSNMPKKNVLFLMIGPPNVPVYWWRLNHVGESPCRLLDQEFALSAEFRTFHVTPPRNWFVPDFVRT